LRAIGFDDDESIDLAKQFIKENNLTIDDVKIVRYVGVVVVEKR